MQVVDLKTIAPLFVGALDFDHTDAGLTPRRLPPFTRACAPQEMQRVIATPSGIRIEFLSDTTEISLDVHLSLIQAGASVPAATIDLVVDGECVQSQADAEGDLMRVIGVNEMQRTPGPAVCYQFLGLENKRKRIALSLPVNAVVEVRGLNRSLMKCLNGSITGVPLVNARNFTNADLARHCCARRGRLAHQSGLWWPVSYRSICCANHP